MAMVEEGDYFIISRPRQYGKTTILYLLFGRLKDSKEHLVFNLSFLRAKYLRRHLGYEKAFHSVVLAGVHDIKTLKVKIRSETEQKYNSPWNIAADFEVVMSLQPEEIIPMLEDYAKERKVEMYNILDPVVNMGMLYGIFGNGRGIKIHNRVYEEVIYNYMVSKVKREIRTAGYNFRDNFILPGNRLDLPKVLERFQIFMKEQHSRKDLAFLERHGRLIFLAFIKPIINGAGIEALMLTAG